MIYDPMGRIICYRYDWYRTTISLSSKLHTLLYLLILVSSCIKVVVPVYVSQSDETGCSLDFQSHSVSDNSSCREGNWGGFLHKSCCGSGFKDYLYALGQHANQTGNIFLESSEQQTCLASLKELNHHTSGCGIEKLTNGYGGCSDFSVDDVTSKFGTELRTLRENCKLTSSTDGEWDQSCGSCLNSWEDIRGKGFFSFVDPAKDETDICRFTVLVTVTSSRIADKEYVQTVYKCLGEHNINDVNKDQESDEEATNKSNSGLILIGCLTGVGLLLIIVTYIIFKRCYKSNDPPKRHAFKDVQLKEAGCPKFSIKELYSATDNLNDQNFIGEGTAGKVYKGILSNNQQVAIKHIVNDVNAETFVREITSLSHVRHHNLVALMGYCLREDECFLVYELCPNGNLSEWLFGKDKKLSWIQRLEIAIDSARGLWFLHTYTEGCIVHRDIKPTNILLGPNFEAMLSDFGLSKVIDLGETQVSSEVRGTFGYVDPEYQCNHQVTSFGDVYSFGIVLLQILSGRKVINLNLKNPMPLNKMAKALTRGGSIEEFADPKLDGEYSAEAFDLILHLALSCTALKQDRPAMAQVFVKLEEALELSIRETAPISESSTL